MNSRTSAKSRIKGQKGQIVVEYVLLLIVAVALGATIVSLMVGRSNPENPGFVIQAWQRMIGTVGNDLADDVDQAGREQ